MRKDNTDEDIIKILPHIAISTPYPIKSPYFLINSFISAAEIAKTLKDF